MGAREKILETATALDWGGGGSLLLIDLTIPLRAIYVFNVDQEISQLTPLTAVKGLV